MKGGGVRSKKVYKPDHTDVCLENGEMKWCSPAKQPFAIGV